MISFHNNYSNSYLALILLCEIMSAVLELEKKLFALYIVSNI